MREWHVPRLLTAARAFQRVYFNRRHYQNRRRVTDTWQLRMELSSPKKGTYLCIWPPSLRRRAKVEDPELQVGPIEERLDNSAARQKLSVRPKRKHAERRAKALARANPGGSAATNRWVGLGGETNKKNVLSARSPRVHRANDPARETLLNGRKMECRPENSSLFSGALIAFTFSRAGYKKEFFWQASRALKFCSWQNVHFHVTCYIVASESESRARWAKFSARDEDHGERDCKKSWDFIATFFVHAFSCAEVLPRMYSEIHLVLILSWKIVQEYLLHSELH